MKVGDLGDLLRIEEKELERLLGILWDPKTDCFWLKFRINLSPLKRKFHKGPDMTRKELQENSQGEINMLPVLLAGAIPLQSNGVLAPVLLLAKVLLRKTWEAD